MCFGLTDKRWTLAPDPFCVPLPGSHLASCGWHLQPSKKGSRLTLPSWSRSRLLPVRSSLTPVSMEGWTSTPAGRVCAGLETNNGLQICPRKRQPLLPHTQTHTTKIPLDCRNREKETMGNWGVSGASEEFLHYNGFSVRQKLLQAFQGGSPHGCLLGERRPHNVSRTLRSQRRQKASSKVNC